MPKPLLECTVRKQLPPGAPSGRWEPGLLRAHAECIQDAQALATWGMQQAKKNPACEENMQEQNVGVGAEVQVLGMGSARSAQLQGIFFPPFYHAQEPDTIKAKAQTGSKKMCQYLHHGIYNTGHLLSHIWANISSQFRKMGTYSIML